MTQKQSRATKQAASQRAAEKAAAIRREQQVKERRRRTVVVSVVVVAVLALILGIGYAVQANRDTTGQAGSAPHGASGGYGVPVGNASAPAHVSVYEDPMCPYCGAFEAASRSWVQKDIDAGKLQMDYHMVAFLDRSSTTQYSSRAVNAMAAVLNSSGPTVFKKFHDLLYANQPQEGSAGLSDAKLLSLAVQAGANKSAVSDAISNNSYKQWVTNATDAMSKHGVTGTPTVFVNGKKFNYTSVQSLSSELQQAVAAQH
ncbi:MAG: DsbA family protein [Mycobacteriaceae bacterium]